MPLNVLHTLCLDAMLGCVPLATVVPANVTLDNTASALDTIEVRSARLDGVAAFDVPASLDVIDLDDGHLGINASASEALGGIPGLIARERQNYAQDTQLSIRGFGARSTFGVRGVRLYADGIPATMPDGQGQLSHFSLQAADRIEVMRGPFSALYGNSSGGVVQIWSADGEAATRTSAQATFGPDASRSVGARLLGEAGRVGYNVAASVFDTDGYRDHSAAKRRSANVKLHSALGDNGTITLIANDFSSPDSQDPLGLTRQQMLENPRQATSVAHQFNTRKSVEQTQVGAVLEQAFAGGHTLRAMAYGGRRAVEQILPLPVGAQSNPLNAGGVIDLDGDYAGADLRWSWQGEWGGRQAEFSAGINADRQQQDRRGFENFVGETLGVRGNLRREESNRVENTDQYVQAWWELAQRWSLLAGARRSDVRFVSRDQYITANNPDDSGRVDYAQTTPVAGLVFAPNDDLRLYLSAGRGFETPTFNELGYRADGGAGLAFDLQPAVSRNIEFGTKWRGESGVTLEAALFRADTDDELAVARNVGGRSSFRNVGAARREGIEAAFHLPFGEAWQADLAYTRTDATFRDGFAICTAAGCTTPGTLVAAGTRIPGVPRDHLSAQLQWSDATWTATAQVEAVGNVTVNDTATEHAAGYTLLHLELSRDWRIGSGSLRGFARIDNAFDRTYIGSVIVNEGNGRYFEPAPGRGLSVGARWSWSAD